ncbi:hypothetical protein WN944_016337 [Citrus x changshan-huyou]|uniref:Uncharacterized protein n=1 Tax=Citrus x changshan-huyou TaxID=2935761 RepID=A0AAP0M959_9ROSI
MCTGACIYSLTTTAANRQQLSPHDSLSFNSRQQPQRISLAVAAAIGHRDASRLSQLTVSSSRFPAIDSGHYVQNWQFIVFSFMSQQKAINAIVQPFIISKSGKHSSLVDGADEKCFLDGGKKGCLGLLLEVNGLVDMACLFQDYHLVVRLRTYSYRYGRNAFGPHEDDVIIKHRLLTRTTTTRGEPPLKKLQKKFTSFVLEIEKDEDNNNDCEKLAKAFLQELSTFEIPLLKSKAVIDANLREKENFNELKEEINRQILQAKADIEDLKKQLEESKIERQHKEECEAIRKLIAVQPPRSETQRIITDLEKEIAALEAENTAGSRLLELRKKQFALLLHVVDELQNTMEEEQKNLIEEMRMAEEQKGGMEDASGGSEAMAVD